MSDTPRRTDPERPADADTRQTAQTTPETAGSETDSSTRPPEDIDRAAAASDHATDESSANERPKEIGGRDGPDPVRYGDWEKGGRCIDF
ncbi:MAG: succinate dehydrogenase assembly factor 4 [Pseudomonadota bacterium]